jgi:site-specific recombinase XerD
MAYAATPNLDNMSMIQDWLTYLLDKRGRMRSTVTAYATILYNFSDSLGGRPILSATIEDLETFAFRLRKFDQKAMPATIAKDANAVKSFYNWCHEQGLTATNLGIALHAPTVRNRQPRSIFDDDWLSYWNHIMVDSNNRMTVAFGLGFFCGLRRDEIVKLRGSQILGDQIVNFRRKGGGEDTLNWLTMHDCYRQGLPRLVGNGRFPMVLRDLAESRGDQTLLGWSDPGSFNDATTRMAGRVGAVSFTPHQLRHSCATNLLRCGVPIHLVSSLLNHRSIDTTMRYVRAGHNALAEWMDGQHGRHGPPDLGGGLGSPRIGNV